MAALVEAAQVSEQGKLDYSCVITCNLSVVFDHLQKFDDGMQYVNNRAFVTKILYFSFQDFLNHCPSGRLNKKMFIEYCQRLNSDIGQQNSLE